jgi:hypothetical protein
MVSRKAIGFWVVATLVLSVGMLAQKKDDKRQSDDQRREIQDVIAMADAAAAGQPAPNDLGLTWAHEDFLKAQGNKQYAPFTVTIDPTKTTSGTLALYWRVVSKDAPPPPPAEGKDGRKKDDDRDRKNQKRPEYAYEDISFVPVNAQSAPMRISRSLTVAAGAYDVYVVVKEPSSQQKNVPPVKASVIKQGLTVPNFWSDELTTSTVIVAQRIEPLPTPLTPQQQVERPYALGGIEIVPVTDTRLSKQGELQTFMIIYNPKVDGANKPDVIVEYNFYTKAGGAEKFFNKTSPQNLNAQTLPPQFDIAAGHQLQAGQGVPLASFPEGDYRLEIKVTDKIANKSLTRDVSFTVSGS